MNGVVFESLSKSSFHSSPLATSLAFLPHYRVTRDAIMDIFHVNVKLWWEKKGAQNKDLQPSNIKIYVQFPKTISF